MRLASLLTIFGTPHFQAICFVLVSAAAIEALIAIWAATSRALWLWRALAVWGGIALLLPIRAYQPALVLVISSPLTIVLIWALRPRADDALARTRPAFRFSVRDLLLTTAIVGVLLATGLQLLPRVGKINVVEFPVMAAVQAFVPVFAWAFVTSRRRLWGGALVAAVITSACALYSLRRWLAADWALIDALFERIDNWGLIRVSVFAAGEYVLILLAVLSLASHAPHPLSGGKSLVRAAAAVLGAAWLVGLGLIYCQMLWLLPLPDEFSTGPTNYDRLLEICQRAVVIEKAGFPPASEPERQLLIAEAAALAESANFIPYNPRTDATLEKWNEGFLRKNQNVRSLARAIDYECGAAISRGQTERASELALTNVRLGTMLQRGGTVVEFLIGVAVQGIANKRLVELRSDPPPAQARQIIAAWDRALVEQEDVDSIIDRDRAMAERAYGWAARLSNVLDDVGIPSEVYFAIREADSRLKTAVRLLQTELAIGMYQHDLGVLPDRLEQLVPTYLVTLQPDEYSGLPLVYRRQDDGFVLYSIGLDRTNDGGKFTNMRTYYSRDSWGNLVTGYDFDLEMLTRP
jgi:hypothetical protein